MIAWNSCWRRMCASMSRLLPWARCGFAIAIRSLIWRRDSMRSSAELVGWDPGVVIGRLAVEGSCGRGVSRVSRDPAGFIRKLTGVPLARSSFSWRRVSAKSGELIGQRVTLRPQTCCESNEVEACSAPPEGAAMRCPFLHPDSGVRVML